MANVLLVEDSVSQATEIRMVLESNSHTVHHVTNGRTALGVLADETIDVVVTDLVMPGMNGLELVEAMLESFQHIPAILVTARGSEELAALALQKGAAGYVPKSHLRELLNDTITNILGVIRTDASYTKLISTMQKNAYVFELSNDTDLISPLVSLLMQMVSGKQLISGNDMVRLGVAVEHALLNAMYRGNLELEADETPHHHAAVYEGATTELIENRLMEAPYRDRTVHVEATAGVDEIRILIRDQGKGFDTSLVPDAPTPNAFDSDSGRGLMLMKSFADELIFNDQGNEVTIVKKCRP